MKITLAGEVAARDKPRKGGTLLCAKKPPRKKKGKKATSEAGYPLYSTSGADGEYLCLTYRVNQTAMGLPPITSAVFLIAK
jgi:hypothetical protein